MLIGLRATILVVIILSKVYRMLKIKADAKTPYDKQIIHWIVDDCSGSTICEAWRVQHEIDCLERDGYKIIKIERHK